MRLTWLFCTLQLFTRYYFLFLLSSSFPAAVIGTRLHIAVAASCMSMAFYLVFLKWPSTGWEGVGLAWAGLGCYTLRDNVCSNPQRPFLKHKQILHPPLTCHLASLHPCESFYPSPPPSVSADHNMAVDSDQLHSYDGGEENQTGVEILLRWFECVWISFPNAPAQKPVHFFWDILCCGN